jgi:RHS repeat-associated protein
VLRDQNGTPLGYEQNGTEYAFVTDSTGSVTAVIGSYGCTDASYAYDPYGNITSESGSDARDNLLLYTGALTDPFGTGATTGYVHDGNRWYSPATGNFTTQDTNNYLANPADRKRYAYAGDNPANYIDPTGQSWWNPASGTGEAYSPTVASRLELSESAGGLSGLGLGITGIITSETGAGGLRVCAGIAFGYGSFVTGLNDVANNGACS